MSARRALLLLLLLAVLCAGGYYGYKALAPQQPVPVVAAVPVHGVPYDGDTLRVQQAADGTSAPVRVLGIDAPEISPDECYGREARDAVQGLLTGQEVVLTPDPAQPDKDKYNRLLRYVQAPGIPDLGAELIAQGYARVYEEYPVARTQEYRVLQEQARIEGRGGWAECSW